MDENKMKEMLEKFFDSLKNYVVRHKKAILVASAVYFAYSWLFKTSSDTEK